MQTIVCALLVVLHYLLNCSARWGVLGLCVLDVSCITNLFSCLTKPQSSQCRAAFSDSDWGNNVDHRRSVKISGYIIYLGTTIIVWKSKYQKGAQALSSCEAEYSAMVVLQRSSLACSTPL